MRIIFLNAAYGRVGKDLFDFIESNSQKSDVFCFQEVDGRVLTQIEAILTDFIPFQIHKDIYNLATFIKKSLLPKEERDILGDDTDVGAVGLFSLSLGPKNLYVSNVHGISQPGDKKDNPARIEQTKKIIKTNSEMNGPRVIGGDFNLLPDTHCIKMLEMEGYVNLIKKFDIRNTRNSHAWRQAQELAKNGIPHYGKQHFADYVFVSPEIKVRNFEVPDIEISDHLPLILDFAI
jgi:endonuclease/exonuclease/phosphatase family metal-dependent hydrolase